MQSAIDLRTSWDGWIVFATLLMQISLVWAEGGASATTARIVLTLSLLVLCSMIVSTLYAGLSCASAKAGRRSFRRWQSYTPSSSGHSQQTRSQKEQLPEQCRTARRARDQGVVVGLFLPFLSVLAAVKRELITPTDTFTFLSMAFAQAWQVAWMPRCIDHITHPAETFPDRNSGQANHTSDGVLGSDHHSTSSCLTARSRPIRRREIAGYFPLWQRALRLLWLYIAPVFILKYLMDLSWGKASWTAVTSATLYGALRSEAFEGTFTHGEALLVSFLAAAAWSSPFASLQMQVSPARLNALWEILPVTWSARFRGDSLPSRSHATEIPRFFQGALKYPTGPGSPSVPNCMTRTVAFLDEPLPPQSYFEHPSEQVSLAPLHYDCRRFVQRFLLKASVELAIGGTLLVTKWHQWLRRYQRAISSRQVENEFATMPHPKSTSPRERCTLYRYRRTIGLLLPITIFLPSNYLMLRIALETAKASRPGSEQPLFDSCQTEPAAIVWRWVSSEFRIMALVLYWASVLFAGIGMLGPHRWGWRRIVARKYYHLLALLLFLPAFLRNDPELWMFLGFAQTVAFTVLVLIELIRVSGVLASARGQPYASDDCLTTAQSATDSCMPARNQVRTEKRQPVSLAPARLTLVNKRHHGGYSIYDAIHHFMTALVDERDEGNVIVSHLYLLLGCAAPGWVLLSTFERWPAPTHAVSNLLTEWSSGLLSLGVFDTTACILGNRFGKHHWPRCRKTLEGSLGGFIAAWLVHHLLLVWYDAGQWRVISRDVASFTLALFLCMIFEALTAQNDNLVLPMFYFAALALLPA